MLFVSFYQNGFVNKLSGFGQNKRQPKRVARLYNRDDFYKELKNFLKQAGVCHIYYGILLS